MAQPNSYAAYTYPQPINHTFGASGDIQHHQQRDGLSINGQQVQSQQNGFYQNSSQFSNRETLTSNLNGDFHSQSVTDGQKYASPAELSTQYNTSLSTSQQNFGSSQGPLVRPLSAMESSQQSSQYQTGQSNIFAAHNPSFGINANKSASAHQLTGFNHGTTTQATRPSAVSKPSPSASMVPAHRPSSGFHPISGLQEKSLTPPPSFISHDTNTTSSRSTPTRYIPSSANSNSQIQPSNFVSLPQISSAAASQMPKQQFARHGGMAPPPLPGQPYQQPSLQKNLPPPPLPGQSYVSAPPGNEINRQHGTAAPPPMPGTAAPPPMPGTAAPPPMPGTAAPPPMPGTAAPPPLSGTAAPPLPGQSYSVNSPSVQPAAHQNNWPPPYENLQPPHPQPQPPMPNMNQTSMHNVTSGFANMQMGGKNRPVNLLQETRLLPVHKPVDTPLKFETSYDNGMMIPPDRKNCHPDVFRCTLKAIPHTQSLLQKVKLPLGLVVHPFKDLSSLPVISAGSIVRCKRCRTYINPFVSFIDERRWRCNMCFVVNEVPEEFLHHPVTKTYGEPHTRPECTNSTIEFIAPQEYMLRPPQPAVYLFLLDVSHSAVETGYLQIVCNALLDHLDHLPGDSRMQIGFLTYNQTVHFYRLNEGLSQPQMLIVSDIEDAFVPTPENLLVNLRESKNLVHELLHQLPKIHSLVDVGEVDTYSALGSALEVAKKMMSAVGGRVTVFQHSLPSTGPGKLSAREDPNIRAGDVPTSSLNPATDFYKKLALDCSANQVAVDFFFINSHYTDIATLSCSSRFSAGDVHYYPGLHVIHNPNEAERLGRDLERYLTRKIGFESVMRIRCTKGLNIHTFHGNFFVRSTDLLALANVNPDAGFAVNLAIEDPLTDLSVVCFQAALLYTTSKGERRIRVHTMCIPVVKTAADVLNAVDSVAVVSLLAKMAVDRSITASLNDARDALVNAVIDPLKAYKDTLPQGMTTGGVYVPPCLRVFPLYIHSLLKHVGLRIGISTKLDDRVFAMVNFKMQPASYLIQDIHPDLYRVDDLNEEGCIEVGGRIVPQPNLLPLSAESLTQSGSFLLDCGWSMLLLVGRSTSRSFIENVLGYPQFSSIEDPMYNIPDQENSDSELFFNFLEWLRDQRPHHAPIRVIRDDSRERFLFLSYLHQDRFESTKSLQDFLLHIQQKLN